MTLNVIKLSRFHCSIDNGKFADYTKKVILQLEFSPDQNLGSHKKLFIYGLLGIFKILEFSFKFMTQTQANRVHELKKYISVKFLV